MKKNALTHKICVWLLVMMIPAMVAPLWATASGTADHPAFQLLKIGKRATGAVDLKVSTQRPPSPGFMPGDRLSVQLTARKALYLLAVNVSSKGTVTILFPNSTMPDSKLEPGKEYSFFAKDSNMSLVLGDQSDGGGTVLYMSRQPVNLSPLQFPKEGACISFSGESKQELAVIRKALTALAGTKGFRRMDLPPFKDDQGNRYNLEVIRTGPTGVKTTEAGPVKGGAVDKGLPTGLKSSRPETITGAAGYKSNEKDELGDSQK